MESLFFYTIEKNNVSGSSSYMMSNTVLENHELRNETEEEMDEGTGPHKTKVAIRKSSPEILRNNVRHCNENLEEQIDRKNDLHEDRDATGTSLCGKDYETVFTAAKAGMEDVDLDKVKKIVFEMSKDSKHHQNEQRKMKQLEERICQMKQRVEVLTHAEMKNLRKLTDAKISELEATRDLSRTWIHVDMDAFFAAVEERDNPSLRGKPFAVGSIGMISTASYEARKYGVRSAMPGFIALKLCPQLIFVRPTFEKYQKAAELTRQVFQKYDPEFEAGSLDEAYLDITSYIQSNNVSSSQVAMEIRQNVQEVTGGLTCSCGVACNRTLAKICSDIKKPNGQFVLKSERDVIRSFVSTLPVRKWPGIGRVTGHILSAFCVQNCSDLLEQRDILAAAFSPTSLNFFLHCALGIGATIHSESQEYSQWAGRKGISVERTFSATSNLGALEPMARDIAYKLAEHMAQESLRGKTFTLKVKLSSFEIRTRSITLDRYVSTSHEIYDMGMKLLRAIFPLEIRLLGFRISNFQGPKAKERGQKSLEEAFESLDGKSLDLGRKNLSIDKTPPPEALHKGNSSESFGWLPQLSSNSWNQNDILADQKQDNSSHFDSKINNSMIENIEIVSKRMCLLSKEYWTCSLCTFAENKRGIDLACQICQTPRSGHVCSQWYPSIRPNIVSSNDSKVTTQNSRTENQTNRKRRKTSQSVSKDTTAESLPKSSSILQYFQKH